MEALHYINGEENCKFIIHTESSLIIDSIISKNVKKTLISKIIDLLFLLKNKNFEVILCLNSSINIEASLNAKKACELINFNQTRVLYDKFIKKINQIIKSEWNEEWKILNTKLHNTRQNIFELNPAILLPRKSQKIITRLRIGHTHLTHSYLINKEQRSLCNFCDCYVSTEHLLVNCPKFTSERSSLNLSNTIKELLSDKNQCEKTIQFCKKINVIDQI